MLGSTMPAATHIGIALPGTLARRDVLTAHFANGTATYMRGLPA